MEYGLIGKTLKHSFSKEIHEKLQPYKYDLIELNEEQFISFMLKKDFKAINVTIPYKENALKYIDECSQEVKEIGCVNTIVNFNQKLIGYNTDYLGMLEMIQHFNIQIENKNVYILGNGGTSKTAKYVAKVLKAKSIHIVSRKESLNTITYTQLYLNADNVQIIINTTPAEMYPNHETKLLDLSLFSHLSGVIDVVYNPLKTNLILQAENKKIPCCGGLYMLISQAFYASNLFTFKSLNKDLIFKIYTKIMQEKQNIVLIGMPTSGKSTIGKLLAHQLNKNFIDTDEEIVQYTKMDIKTIFQQYGEAYFRKLESQIIKNIASKNNYIIATGGGIILNTNNINYLKQNGKIYFLNKSLHNLFCTDDRPLSSTFDDLKRLYDNRYPLYLNSCDEVINADLDINEIVLNITKDWRKDL